MSVNQESISYMLENLKDGDALGFYANKIGSKIIAFFTGAKIDHVGMVYEVEKNEDSTVVQFKFSEQTVRGGKFRQITLTSENIAATFEKRKIFYAQLKKPLTEAGKRRGIQDAETQAGKQYGFLSLPFGMNWLECILPNFIVKKLKKIRDGAEYKRVCSQHGSINAFKNGSLPKSIYDERYFYDPYEFVSLDIFKLFKIKR